MTRRALVIGCELPSLRGPINDVRSMTGMLQTRGFVVDTRWQATRNDILNGYDALIEASQPGDTAVVYYSGHGYYALLPGDPRPVQCIAPVDIKSDTEWRGITSWELSIKQKQLTRRTQNVTVILDCCHASHMSREAAAAGAVARALPHPVTVGIDAYLAAMREQYGEDFDHVDRDGNPDAVRFVATGKSDPAWEDIGSDGLPHGYFTSILLDVLHEVGEARVSWAAVARVVRARLLRRYASQRPEVEGPAHRRLFELDRVDDAAAASVTGRDGVYEIQTGLLGGDRVGDVYAVLPVNAVAHDVGKEVAKLQVVAVHPVISQATLAGGAASLHVGAVAVPIIRTAPKHPVRVDVHEDAFDSVAAAVAATPTLFVANPSDPAPLASLKLTGDMLSVEDAGGPLLVGARFPEELTSVLKCIAGLGVARSLYSLLGEHGVHAREVEVELGVVYGGERRSIPPTGAALGLRDRVYISVKNRSDRPLWFHVLNVGLRGTISSQTSRQFPGGVRLEGSSEPFIVGGGEGIQLAWPDGLPRGTFPRTDTIVVFATTTSADLQSIETHALAPTRRTAGTPLETLVAQMRDGVDRSAAAVDGFFATRVSFELHPRDAAMGGLSFDIDDAPGILSAARAPAAWHAGGDAPTSDVDDERAIVIRAVELVVDDASGSGGPDVRIDALVCTRSVDGQFATWSQYLEPAASHRFTDDAAVLFRGRVRDFVDIALFVSRDDGRRLALAELFAERASHADVAAACKGLVAAPGTPWVTAVGSSAVLARMAYGLLRGLAGHSMGLYRTSFLAHEEFGVGRHPRAGVYRAQNISFSLLVAGAEM